MTVPPPKSFVNVDCEVAFDNLTRQLYATDASIYQLEPAGVAFPRNASQAGAVIRAAADASLSVTPRGAGTGLVGGALGQGIIVDFARHNRQIADLNLERGTVRVGAGVILDQLNTFLRPHRMCFGPDVATSSRATLGGMIANDSSGSHTPVYGTTAHHVSELEIVMSDGSAVLIGPQQPALPRQRDLVEDIIQFHALKIAETFPPGLLKRWPGYGLANALRDPGNLNYMLAGSEGTLAAIMSAELKIVPLPKERGLGLVFFNSVAAAMQATVELLDLKPAAIEHLDRVLFDQTKGQLEFQAARDLLDLDHRPCESILAVEFFENVEDKLAELARRKLGLRKLILTTPAEANLIWSLRKAGLSLLTGCKGDAKPVTGIEDAAIAPERLPEYVAALEAIMHRQGFRASYYGHAASGLLHVRPVIDLHSAEELKRFRQLANEFSAIVKQFKGSLAGEHGVGIARTEFLRQHLGDLMEVMTEIKASFDPHNLFNPGKIIPVAEDEFRIDRDLRRATAHELTLPFEPVLAFAAKDGSFVRNLEQCNGCGGCRKESPTMCPTFIATGEEIMSTRGRANAIRAALELRGIEGDPLRSAELDMALSNCLACKACTSECPSNVNLALLKAELAYARIRKRGLTLRDRTFSAVDALGRLGCMMPGLANSLLEASWPRRLMKRFLGITTLRPLPRYATQRFDAWFARQSPPPFSPRGRVVLWDDTFVRYHEPNIGAAAVKVLQAAGFQVELPRGRQCCGRPAFSQGNLAAVAENGRHNLALLNQHVDNAPILFLEPSCYSMFAEDYREMKLPNAERISKRCFLFEEFLEDLLAREADALKFHPQPANIVIHAHCHLKSLKNPGFLRRLAERLPGRRATLLDTGCCGMAGSFGVLASKYELSLKVAEPLMEKLKGHPFGTVVVASGTSCRHQISHLAPIRPRHMAEVLAEAIA